jgi:osmotically-inducible protein OsmY
MYHFMDGLMKNDIQVQKEVVAELDHAKDIQPGTIGVEVHHGVVKLAGGVANEAARESSALAAERVVGVTNVILDVDVAGARTAV